MRISIIVSKQIKRNGWQLLKYQVSHGKSGTPNQVRKSITTGVNIKLKDFDNKNFRAKISHPAFVQINQSIKELEDRRDEATVNYSKGNWDVRQVINFLKSGGSQDSVDNYVESIIKETKSNSAYTDYKNTLNAYRKYTGIMGELRFEDFNYNSMDSFRRNALAKISGNSVNSYFTKIRAIMNDAYDRGYVHKKFVLNRKLRCATKPKMISTITSDQFLEAIEKINTYRDWQSLAFYLLMFCTRGMYPTDIASFRYANLENEKKFSLIDWDDNTIFENGEDYLIHKRSKTRRRSNPDMIIRIDGDIMALIVALKMSVIYTHGKKYPKIIPPLEDKLAIFDYDIEKTGFHNNLWDYYKKRVTLLLNNSFKTARKTFNTIAGELKISDSIRRALLGHADQTVLSHYDNLNTKKMRELVEEAHIKVLDDFKTSHLVELLMDKLITFDVPGWANQTIAYKSLNEMKKKINKDLKTKLF